MCWYWSHSSNVHNKDEPYVITKTISLPLHVGNNILSWYPMSSRYWRRQWKPGTSHPWLYTLRAFRRRPVAACGSGRLGRIAAQKILSYSFLLLLKLIKSTFQNFLLYLFFILRSHYIDVSYTLGRSFYIRKLFFQWSWVQLSVKHKICSYCTVFSNNDSAL